MTTSNNVPSEFLTSFSVYAQELDKIARSPIQNAWPEDQLKTPVTGLFRNTSTKVEASTEVRMDELKLRPDIGVSMRGALCGFVELKAPGLGSDTAHFKDRNKIQWEKLCVLPNIIYTDGLEFSLYRNGKRVGQLIRLAADLSSVKSTKQKNIVELYALLQDFLSWKPIVPKTPRALAEMLAPLCRLLREEVLLKMQDNNSSLAFVNKGIRESLLSEVSTEQFADIYAQTLTYSLLLARLNGEDQLTTASAVRDLESGHGLLAAVLRQMTEYGARRDVETSVSILERVIAAVEPAELQKGGRDPWLYFYEDFLGAYDKKLRSNRGVYYTPSQVIGAQVRLVAELLVKKFHRPLAFAGEDVLVLDPAAGTSAYPLAVVAHALKTEESNSRSTGNLSARATQLAKNVYAFEILVGPYAVGHLRLSQIIQGAGGTLPKDGIQVYLTDTLESPHADLPTQTLSSKALSDEHKRASDVKKRARIMVCIGNPPYDRESFDPAELEANPDLQRKGGWVRHGDKDKEGEHSRPILRDFIEPAEVSGAGKHIKNLYNDYVYFWRWALWKMFENPESNGPGIVSYITASSYLRGPGFVGMRRKMREAFDELWIIDLEGDQLGARKTENVFAIQTPVAIAIGARYSKSRTNTPAKVRYTRIIGNQTEKFAALDKISSLTDLTWQDCLVDWEAPLLPIGVGNYFNWPLLTEMFPWQACGVKMERSWPIGETKEALEERWRTLTLALLSEKKILFREDDDRKVDRQYFALLDKSSRLPTIASLPAGTQPQEISRFSFRSFDRKFVIADNRIGGRMNPALWACHSDKQVYLTSLLTGVLGMGPAAIVCSDVPDLHYFCGRGAKDVIPLWRDADGNEANLTYGLAAAISKELNATVSAEDLFAYTYAILSTPDYVATFSEELTLPGPRIPITKDKKLFAMLVELGRKLIRLHTYTQRMVPDGGSRGQVPQGSARCLKGVPGTAEGYPDEFSYEDTQQLLRVGKGEFAAVPKAVFEFSVSGLFVVKSWLRYRMKAGAGKSSSPLDKIRPDVWTAQMTQELLELLWVLEATVKLYPELSSLLKDICAGKLFEFKELPKPNTEERKPPKGTQEESDDDRQIEMPSIVAESSPEPSAAGQRKSKCSSKKTGTHTSRNLTEESVADLVVKYQAFCPHCKKVVPQMPSGYPEVRKGTVRQTYICSMCKNKNRMETRVR
jgi:hypothetical protein